MENTMFTVLQTAGLCHHFKQWKLLEEQIASFARRHGQFKEVKKKVFSQQLSQLFFSLEFAVFFFFEVIQKLVQTCVKYLDDTPDVETKLSFMDALLGVAEGKVKKLFF